MRLLNIPKKPLLESSLALACELLLAGGEMVCYNITAYNEIIDFTVSKREVYYSKLRAGTKAERGMVMKCKNLERAVILGLILSAGVYGSVWAADANLTQKNIHFRNGYSKEYDNVDITLTTTGRVGSNASNNYDKDDFKPNEGTASGSEALGTAIKLETGSKLKIGGNLNISVVPDKTLYNGRKQEMERNGVVISASSMTVEGDTSITVDNYIDRDISNSQASQLEKYEDDGMKIQSGIYVSGTDGNLNLKGNLNIDMLNGSQSMGLWVTNDDIVNVMGDAVISVKGASQYTFGIGSQQKEKLSEMSSNAGKLHFAKNLSITTSGGNHSIGIDLRDRYRNDEGVDSIHVDGHTYINTSGAKDYTAESSSGLDQAIANYGMFLNNVESATFNTAEIITSTENGCDKAESIGTYLYNSNTTFKGDVKYTTTSGDAAKAIAGLARNGSHLIYEKGFDADGLVTLNAVGGSQIDVNSLQDKNAIVNIKGNLVAGKTSVANIYDTDTSVDSSDVENEINVYFGNEQSAYTGINEIYNVGSSINLNFANGAKWNMTGSTEVTDLTLSKNALLDMTYNNETAASFRTLNAKNLSGNNGIIDMNIDASTNVNNSDRIYVDGTHSGTQYITLNNIGDSTDGAHGTVLVSVKDEQGEFKAKDSEGALFWNTYEIGRKDVTDGEEVTDGYNTDWYLKDINKDEDRNTTSVDTILGANALNYHTWRAENDQLMRRMGELRNNGDDEQGAWFRAHGGKISRDNNAAFENQYTSYELGYDQITKKTEDVTRYTGAALSYTDGNSSYDTGSGENHSKSLSFYNTDIYSSGHYLDLVFKFANMDNDFNVYDTNGNEISGEYKNNGISLSAEYGRKNNLNSGWYIEPQAQLTVGYFGGDEYETSNGIQVDQSGIASVLGRIGFNIGKELGDSGIIYAKANLLHEFAGDYDIDMTDSLGNHRTESESFNDTWFEYGIGAALKTGKNNHLYFDFVKTAGGDFEKDWQWNAGMRWTF